jgi:hypothetical protein
MGRTARVSATLIVALVVALGAGGALTIPPTSVAHAEQTESDGGLKLVQAEQVVTEQQGIVPIYTSPIDITGLKLLLQASAPDRNTGQLTSITLPVGLLDPKLNELLATPLSSQIDQYWSVIRDPVTGLTQREQACATIQEKIAEASAEAGPDYTVYDFSCNLAATGTLLFKQAGSLLYFGYLLTNNTVGAYISSPYTCNRNTFAPLCPNDVGARITFAVELVTTLRTVDVCNIFAGDGEVNLQAVTVDAQGIAELAQFIDRTFLGGKYEAMVDAAVQATTLDVPLPLDAAFQELRENDGCTGADPVLKRLLLPFRTVETVVEPRQGLLMRIVHAGIATPAMDIPNPGNTTPARPVFSAAAISTDKPVVTAGQRVTVSGSAFPPPADLSTMLPVMLGHGGYGPGSRILNGGPCLGGLTEIEWGPVGGLRGTQRTERLPGDLDGMCADMFSATGLTPATAYQFRARDCDAVTCSPWTALVQVTTATTAQANANTGRVTLTLDNSTSLGTATARSNATFTVSLTIPAGTSAGVHKIQAVSGNIRAEVQIEVVTAAATNTGTIRVIELNAGQTGCPANPSEQRAFVDEPFRLFGSGFAPGPVEIRFKSAGGLLLGTLTAGADGTFCGDVKAPTRDQRGPGPVQHPIFAVQNGMVRAQHTISVYVPDGVH